MKVGEALRRQSFFVIPLLKSSEVLLYHPVKSEGTQSAEPSIFPHSIHTNNEVVNPNQHVGITYACIPLRILPPQPPVADAADPKGKGAAKPGKGGAGDAAPAAAAPLINRGALKLRLGVQASESWRDWLRKGEDALQQQHIQR